MQMSCSFFEIPVSRLYRESFVQNTTQAAILTAGSNRSVRKYVITQILSYGRRHNIPPSCFKPPYLFQTPLALVRHRNKRHSAAEILSRQQCSEDGVNNGIIQCQEGGRVASRRNSLDTKSAGERLDNQKIYCWVKAIHA